jgi:GTP 3',8-cyclase
VSLVDQFNRQISYLRISVTDRCNLRCQYCMPEEGVEMLRHEDVLSFEDIVTFTETAVSMGIRKIRLTGGEPLVRKHICQLVALLAKIKGVEDFGMTTNGILLAKYATQLKEAGLQRVNISLDCIDPGVFKKITRCGDINDVFKGIDAAKKAGFETIKINCVIKKNAQEPNAKAVASFGEENNLQVRFIRQMDLEAGQYWVVDGGTGGDCKVCNRLRLTSNGQLKPCLISDLSYDIRKMGFKKAIEVAVDRKPKKGVFSTKNKFHSIGG